MRQWLKYNAANAKEEEVMRKAQAALAVWDQCKAPHERRSFMESFKNDKSKDLAWTHTFFEECANEEVQKEWATADEKSWHRRRRMTEFRCDSRRMVEALTLRGTPRSFSLRGV